MGDAPKKLDSSMVQDIVSAAHSDIEKVKELLQAEPNLVNCSWDWGGGDFETPLGAASHMGRKDIAKILISKGARLDVFAAAMLGEATLVAAYLAFDDTTRSLLGPHKIPLLTHAEAGGDKETIDLLK